ncbi:hypothetical protein K431DRAFT_66275 [Polychaeton citri CBS 116435]|uniref:Uncharacterized protein n=1 Tax=Polychaeton citri CBS 116435 TaxID=1314669 RepID=A0A9P4UPD9_9PEZI|nr:hypothetical protein K431DRAFT_66275 [Polychaeton citri CBS 116435]
MQGRFPCSAGRVSGRMRRREHRGGGFAREYPVERSGSAHWLARARERRKRLERACGLRGQRLLSPLQASVPSLLPYHLSSTTECKSPHHYVSGFTLRARVDGVIVRLPQGVPSRWSCRGRMRHIHTCTHMLPEITPQDNGDMGRSNARLNTPRHSR